MRGEDVKVIQKLYEVILWYFERVERFPRTQRFVIGDRIEVLLLDILDTLIEAKYSRAPGALLQVANLRLERLRYLTRLCLDLKLISLKQHAFAAENVDEVGRQVGGWLKASGEER